MRNVFAALFLTLAAPAALAKTPEARPSDQQFIDRAYSIHQAEIELGKLAQKKGTTQQVRDFGQRMVGDHTVALNRLREVATKNNLNLPNHLDPEEASLYKRLEKLDGKQFDDVYIEHMVSGHKEALRLFQEEADRGQNPALRSYAEKEIPMLRAHEALAKRDLQRG